jgi:hypothetical protein
MTKVYFSPTDSDTPYGMVMHGGKELLLMQPPSPGANTYSADAKDVDGNDYRIKWNTDEDWSQYTVTAQPPR